VNACNLYESNCPADSACIWLDQLEGEVIAQCIAELPLGNQTQGEACHLAQNYWGDCQTDQICMSLFTESLSCMSICDSKNLSVCGQTPEQSHQGCLLDIFSGFEGIGICAGECDPFENSYELLKGYQNPKCPTEMACEYQTYALVANQSEKLIGKCQPFSPNLQRERAVCRVMNAQTGESDCAPNLTCTQIEAGGPSVCVKICQKDNPLGACSSEYECDTKSHQKAWGTTTIGFCL
jgi:hypothetical protein